MLCPTPGDLLGLGIEPISLSSPALQEVSLPLSHQGSSGGFKPHEFIVLQFWRSEVLISFTRLTIKCGQGHTASGNSGVGQSGSWPFTASVVFPCSLWLVVPSTIFRAIPVPFCFSGDIAFFFSPLPLKRTLDFIVCPWII